MSLEIELHPQERVPLLERFVYQDPSLSPASIAEHTSDIFAVYFGQKNRSLSLSEKDYLATKTIPFIDSVRAGLANHPDMVDRLNLSTLEDYSRVVLIDRPSVLPPDETREAIDTALLTMGIMPQVAVKKVIDLEGQSHDMRFSKRSFLKPPETLEEARLRIRELWVETQKVGSGIAPRSFHFLKNQDITRATLFFDVCKSIAIKTEMQKDVEIRLAS